MTGFQLEDFAIFNQPHCKIKNRDYVEKILKELIKGGTKKLQVISDFDYTITKQRLDNGETVLSSFCIFNSCKSLPQNYLDESDKLRLVYRPIEIDPKIPIEEKMKYMVEWWHKSSELLKVSNLFKILQIDDLPNIQQ